jgi:serine/threonine protein phosphatase PrpC
VSQQLSVVIGQHSEAGRKKVNQDYVDFSIPKQPLLSNKGVALGIADGISSSDVSQIASKASVQSFLADYYATSETWSVKKSAIQVLTASNAWLHSQTKQSPYRFDKDRGYICTFSGLILKSRLAYIFHIGDTRIYRLRNSQLEKLTEDHRFWISPEQNYLNRAMGMHQYLEIDHHFFELQVGDIFMLMSDGVYEHVTHALIIEIINQHIDDLNLAAKLLAQTALSNGSTDNLTAQIIHVTCLPDADMQTHLQSLTQLPFPPQLEARMVFDGYTIVRPLHENSRSHVHLAIDNETQTLVVLKTPSVDLRNDPAYLERFLMEEWIARRIDNPHVLKPCQIHRKRHYLYVAAEYIDGQTLTQWMIDHPKTDLETMRNIVEQIAIGLRAFHRLEMLHQDLRPDNIMIDATGTVKIIDFGSTKVAGLMEMTGPSAEQTILGTAPYTAPEYFLGEEGTPVSDLFSLGVIAYQMVIGKLPYGTQVAKIKKPNDINLLRYDEIRYDNMQFPAWADDAIMRAVHPYPQKRYQALSEFMYDLRHPNQSYLKRTKQPLLERNPVAFWQGLSVCLFCIIVFLLSKK